MAGILLNNTLYYFEAYTICYILLFFIKAAIRNNKRIAAFVVYIVYVIFIK